jgi:hypothetical protein
MFRAQSVFSEASRDLTLGQTVIVFARWILVLAGLVIALWNPGPVGELRVSIAVILLAAVANFYLHAQLLRRRPAVDAVAYAASAGDIALVTLLVLVQGGFRSDLFIFYFPAVLAMSVAFPTMVALAFAGTTTALYALVVMVSAAPTDANLQVVLTRLIMLAAVAVCGNAFRRIDEGRRASAEPRAQVSPAREAAEDLFFGQIVIVWARWSIILAGAILTLWTATTPEELAGKIVPIVALMAINFFLHGRYLMERPANQVLLAAVGAVDLALITAVVLTWQGQAGLNSPFFVFYYPVLFAFALILPPHLSRSYTTLALVAYAGACIAAGPGLLGDGNALKVLVLRLVTLAAVGGLGTYYWRMFRRQRREIEVASSPLRAPEALAQVELAPRGA